MLMNRIRDTYRDITGYIEPATPITTVTNQRPAANADNIAKSDMQVRRERRLRRNERVGLHNVTGWSVRTW